MQADHSIAAKSGIPLSPHSSPSPARARPGITPRFAPAAAARKVESWFRDSVRAKASDRWFTVATRSGIPAECLTGERCMCPGCGSDNFRWLDTFGRGRFVCRGGGRPDVTGDGFAALAHTFGLTFAQAVVMAGEALGLRELPKQPGAARRDWGRTGLVTAPTRVG